MWKKGFLIVWVLFSVLSVKSFGSDLKQSQDDIITLIKSGQIGSAKSGIDKLIADYSQDAGLPEALYWVARNYGWKNKYEEERNIYQRLIQNYPDNFYANKAKLGYRRAEVQGLIDSQKYDEAEKAFDSLVADFNSHPDLPDALHWIAVRYEWLDKYKWSSKYEKVTSIFQQIVDKYPGSSVFDRARLGICRMNIYKRIVDGKLNEAKEKIDQMTMDFNNNPDLPGTLYGIAQRYEWSDRYAEANDVYQQIMQNWPGSSYAEKSKFDIQRAQIRSLIASQDYNDANLSSLTLAKAALDKFIADFNGNPDLPESLYWIAQRYGYAGRYEEEKNLYQQIIEDYPDNSFADKAKLDLAGAEVLDLILMKDNNDVNSTSVKETVLDSDANMSAFAKAPADEALEGFVADFNGHPYLPNALLFIVDKYYEKALRSKAKRESSNELYHFTIETMEKYVFDRIGGKDNEAEAYYRAAISAYMLGDAEKTLNYAEGVLAAEPNFRYAANMDWFAADAYEHLLVGEPALGTEISRQNMNDETYVIVEKMYEDLMNKYPASRISDWSAMHLGLINYRQGNNIKACAYFGWYLMNASPDAAQDKIRMTAIKNITEGCGGSASSPQGGNSNGK